MIIVIRPDASKEQLTLFKAALEERYNVTVNTWVGVESTVLGLIGDTVQIDEDWVNAQEFVESVKRVQEPYKKANRKFHPDNTVIELPTGQKIGDGSLCIMAGPCSVETEEQINSSSDQFKLDITVKSDAIIYDYKFNEQIPEDGLDVSREIAEKSFQDSATVDKIKPLMKLMVQYVEYDNPKVVMKYTNADGSLIFEKTFDKSLLDE